MCTGIGAHAFFIFPRGKGRPHRLCRKAPHRSRGGALSGVDYSSISMTTRSPTVRHSPMGSGPHGDPFYFICAAGMNPTLRQGLASGKTLTAHPARKGRPYRPQKKAPHRSRSGALSGVDYSSISMTTPEPTVRPPSRIAKRRPFSMAMGVISSTFMSTLSPGMHISVPSGRVMTPVTSVVRK